MNKKFLNIIVYNVGMHKISKDFHYHFNTCLAMKKLGYDIELVNFGSHTLSKIEEDPSYDPQIPVIYIDSMLGLFVYAYRNRESLVYVNTFMVPTLLLGIFLKKSIFFSHGGVFPMGTGFLKTLKRIFVRFCYYFFTKIRTVSLYENKRLEEVGLGEKSLYLPLPIKTQYLHDKNILADQSNILLLGRITEVKNPLFLLHALAGVIQKYPTVRMFHAGDYKGYEYDGKTFPEWIELLGLSQHITLCGHLDLEDIMLLPTSIYINTSRSEGQCLALYDAAICGNAICAPAIPSFLDILEDRLLLHDPDNLQCLIDNILYYLENPTIRMEHIRKNREYIRSVYTLDNNLQQLQYLFSQVYGQ